MTPRYHLPEPLPERTARPGERLPDLPADAYPPDAGHLPAAKRYRVGPWIVAVLTLLIMAAAAAGIAAAGIAAGREGGPAIIQTPAPSPRPCPDGGPPPCPR